MLYDRGFNVPLPGSKKCSRIGGFQIESRPEPVVRTYGNSMESPVLARGNQQRYERPRGCLKAACGIGSNPGRRLCRAA